jgi:hypothetical protein
VRFEREHARANLAGMVLLAFESAVLHRRNEVAEHLLRALEELARAEPECRATLDRAYLLLDRSGRAH